MTSLLPPASAALRGMVGIAATTVWSTLEARAEIPSPARLRRLPSARFSVHGLADLARLAAAVAVGV